MSIQLQIKVSAGAKKNAVIGLISIENKEYYKIKIAAPAVDDKANRGLIAFLSTLTDESKSHIHISHGTHSTIKTVCIDTAQTEEIVRKKIYPYK